MGLLMRLNSEDYFLRSSVTKLAHFLLFASTLLPFPALAQHREHAELDIDLKGPRHAIDRRIYGQFLEHFGRIIQGGLSAELLRNRKFYPIDPDRTQVADPWKPESDRSKVSYVIDTSESIDGVSSQRISLFGDSMSWRGVSQTTLEILPGKDYIAYAWIKAEPTGQRVVFRLESDKGESSVKVVSTLDSGDWKRYEVHLKSGALRPTVFRILFQGNGMYWVGAASLMPADNVHGLRADVLALVKEMAPPIIRWPGGGYPDEYDWRTAIGPRDRRRPQPILPFGQPFGYDNGIDPNDFGTDEFIDFCRLINAEPYITANFGSGTPAMAGSWVEYTNGPATSPWGKKRADNGHPDAYNVRSWSVGNEIWGDPFESGHTNSGGYSYFLTPIVMAMRASNPNISITAVGLLDNFTGDGQEWNATVLKNNAQELNYLSIHHYYPGGFHPAGFKDQPASELDLAVVAEPWVFEKRLRTLVDYVEQTTGTKRLKIALDEWSEWDWDIAPPTDISQRTFNNQFIDLIGKTGLEFNQTARDALFNARMLLMLERLSNSVPIGVRTHMINSLGAIRTEGSDAYLTAPGVVMEMFAVHSGIEFVPSTLSSPNFDVSANGWKAIPYLDATVAVTGKKLYLHLLNVHPSDGIQVRIRLNARVKPTGTQWQIAPRDFGTRNDSKSKNVFIEKQPLESLSSDMVRTLPAHSVTVIEMEMP